MPTLTFPISRIEGHAQVAIQVREGSIVSANLQAVEFRGFSHFVEGVPADQMPVITPRICGVCSTAHHVASVKALEDAYDITPPPLALTIRELLLLGQIIQNQATSLFIFTMPDRLGTSSIFEVETSPQSDAAGSEIAAQALQVRKAGTDLITTAGGQFIHPIKAVVGGVTSGIDEEQAAAMHDELEQALPIACQLFDYYWQESIAMGERLGTWGDDAPTCYLAAVGADTPNYYGDVLHVMQSDGEMGDSFTARHFDDYLTLEIADDSYAGQTRYAGGVIRANSLARINMAQRMGTPLADDYLHRFRDAFGQPAHAIMLFDLARGIELVYAIERAMAILGQPLNEEETAVAYTRHDGEGYGLVEAPRGPLIHHYVIRDGCIERGEFIIPTVHNVLAIERALRVAAERYVRPDRIDMELERAVGRVVRAFDPCIACATH
jgi:coenzyme F420-reducing hydrogenase alpha subunit